ncbi:MAG: GIY-YIG nuclease family protein [bacterium]|nr:GIY-YIG nuclease family protein [bacterium]
MPKKVMDYSNTHFYKIVCKDTNDLSMYIGHTTNFTKRKNKHKSCCCNESSTHYNLPLYKYIRDQGHWHNWDMVLIETKFCETLLEVKKYERELIDLMKPNLNIARPFVTDDDLKEYRQNYYQENIDTIKLKRQIYRDNHKEQKNISDNIYRENNKEKVSDGKKKYYQENKEYVKQRVKQYREDNREKLLEKIECECGSVVSKLCFTKHKKTVKHCNYLNSIQQPKETPEH